MRSQPLCGASSSPSAPHTQMTWAMQGPRSSPLGIRRKERGHRLARAARRPDKIPRERETRCWDSPTASRCDSTGSSGGKALVLSHGSVSNSSDHSHPAGLGCSREALGSDTFVFGSAAGLRAATAKCQSSQIHWSHLAKAPAQHHQGLQALPAALPQPVHPNRAVFLTQPASGSPVGWEYHPQAVLKTVSLCRAFCWQTQPAHLIFPAQRCRSSWEGRHSFLDVATPWFSSSPSSPYREGLETVSPCSSRVPFPAWSMKIRLGAEANV